MAELAEDSYQSEKKHNPIELRSRLFVLQKGEEPIGWELKASELRFLKVEDLPDGDLALFDQIQNGPIDATKMTALELAIKEHFSGVREKSDRSRYHFQAFLRNLLLSRWYAHLAEQKKRQAH